MSDISEIARASWEARLGIGEPPADFLRACAEKCAGLDDWQAQLETDALVDAYARRQVLTKIGGIGSYIKKAVDAIHAKIETAGGDPVAQAKAIGTIREKVDGVAAALDKLDARLDSLGKKADMAQDARLDAMEEIIKEKDAVIAGLREQIALTQEAASGEREAAKREFSLKSYAIWLGFGLLGLLVGASITAMLAVAMARKLGGVFF